MSGPGEAFFAKGRVAPAHKPPSRSQDLPEEAVAVREACLPGSERRDQAPACWR